MIESVEYGDIPPNHYEFDKYANNIVKRKTDYIWIKEVSSKARKEALKRCETAYKRYFKGLSRQPKYKKKHDPHQSYYFIKDNIKYKDNKIKIPTLGLVKVAEFHKLPDIFTIISGRVIKDKDKYYVTLLYKKLKTKFEKYNKGIGIDLGIKTFATLTNHSDYLDDVIVIPNPKSTLEISKKINKIKEIDRKISAKKYYYEKNMEGGEYLLRQGIIQII